MSKTPGAVFYCTILVLFIGILRTKGDSTAPDATTSVPTTTTTTTTTTTPSPSTTTTNGTSDECQAANKNCETCVKHTKCLWCNTRPEKCILYPVGQLIPHKEVCPLNDARWGVCWVNYKVLLIAMGVVAAVVLISFTCCIYCCCCRKSDKDRQKYLKEEAKLEQEKSERKVRQDERRAERKAKHDEIRKKYGLMKDDNPYERFDA